MAESIVSDVVGRLLGYLGKSAVGKITSYFGGKEKMKQLERTMKMIQARLLDAERSREGESGTLVKEWLKQLKDVLYRLEDLFEEVSITDDDDDSNEKAARELTKPIRVAREIQARDNNSQNTSASSLVKKSKNRTKKPQEVASPYEKKAMQIVCDQEDLQKQL